MTGGNVLHFPQGTPPSTTTTFPQGSGGGGGDMEGRITRLEKDMDEVKGVLHRLEPMIVRIDERLKHIPNTWQLIIAVLTLAATLAVMPVTDVVRKMITPEPSPSRVSQDASQGSPDQK